MTDIQKAGIRADLPARREPFWRHLEGTGYIGYRKMESGVQTWQAKWRGGDGKPLQKSLGKLTKANDFAAASKAAREWFAQCAQGITKAGTVEEACKAYVKNLGKEKPDAAADPMGRFKKLIYDTPFGKKRLDKLLPAHVREWRNALVTAKRSKSTVNRVMRSFKAAMNFAYENGLVANDRAWSVVNPFPVADGQRENFLTKPQLKELLSAAPDDLAALLKGYLYTGCRPGELPKARVKHFDAKAGTLTLSSNKGRDGGARGRLVPLAGPALAFFKEQAKDKLPNAFLMTQAGGDSDRLSSGPPVSRSPNIASGSIMTGQAVSSLCVHYSIFSKNRVFGKAEAVYPNASVLRSAESCIVSMHVNSSPSTLIRDAGVPPDSTGTSWQQ
jgi:integrase